MGGFLLPIFTPKKCNEMFIFVREAFWCAVNAILTAPCYACVMANGNLLAGKQLPPLILTLAETRRVLGPLTIGYAWGEKTIVDLWTQCAPVPGGTVEKRIISPAHLGKWLEDVLTKKGKPLTEQARIYNVLASGGRTHGR